MKKINEEQLNKLFKLANIKTPNDVSEADINKALIEIEKKLLTCSISSSKYQTNRNVLIVDDLEITLHQLTLLLNKSGFNVHVARNFNEAKHNLEKHSYEYVFIDLFIPDVEDGMKIINIVKDTQKNNNYDTSIAIISGTEDKNLISECLKSGADEFIHKAPDWHKNVLKFIKLIENKVKTSNEDYLINYDYSELKLLHIIIRKFHLINTIESIEKEVAGFANSGYKNIVLDFSNVSSMKQQQTELLASCFSKCSQENIKLSLCSVSNDIHNILAYVFLTDVIKIYKNIDEVVTSIKNN